MYPEGNRSQGSWGARAGALPRPLAGRENRSHHSLSTVCVLGTVLRFYRHCHVHF